MKKQTVFLIVAITSLTIGTAVALSILFWHEYVKGSVLLLARIEAVTMLSFLVSALYAIKYHQPKLKKNSGNITKRLLRKLKSIWLYHLTQSPAPLFLLLIMGTACIVGALSSLITALIISA
jgi:hypothetical protein